MRERGEIATKKVAGEGNKMSDSVDSFLKSGRNEFCNFLKPESKTLVSFTPNAPVGTCALRVNRRNGLNIFLL